jgi:hypothetical protein
VNFSILQCIFGYFETEYLANYNGQTYGVSEAFLVSLFSKEGTFLNSHRQINIKRTGDLTAGSRNF